MNKVILYLSVTATNRNQPRRNETMNDLTSNQFYGGMNRRFDNRAALLRRFGFQYEILNTNKHDSKDSHAKERGYDPAFLLFQGVSLPKAWECKKICHYPCLRHKQRS